MKEINWKYNINDRLTDDKRDIIIIDKKIRKKETWCREKGKYNQNQRWYKYKCNKCGNEDWIIQSSLNRGSGCNICNGTMSTKLGFNTIWDKARWMVDLGISEEDAKKYTPQSHKKIKVICPICGETKTCAISKIYANHSIGCICSDSIPYGEKFVYGLLKQLNIDFITQLSNTTFKWCDNKKYDFYIPLNNTIIEVNGIQHYKENNRGLSLEEEIKNDIFKKELALNNGISNYIVIDCRKSDFEWLYNSILNSELINLFDLNGIDWIKCEEFARNSNFIKSICDYKNNNKDSSILEISRLFGFSKSAIRNWLKIGTKLGWCEYKIN